ncbi:hypothetical protein ACHAW6_006078 [Cyclotella cf. meneghiniana]
MITYEQSPHNNKTNVVFMTMIDIEGQLSTDQTDCFPISSNSGSNYITRSNHIPSSQDIATNSSKCTKKFINYSNFEAIIPNFINLITRHRKV